MNADEIHRLTVTWDKARGLFQSFFAGLEAVKKEIGEAALPEWCRSQLGISYENVVKATRVLNDTDESRLKREFEPALRMEKEARRKEEYARKLEEANYQRELAEIHRETARLDAEAQSFKAPIVTPQIPKFNDTNLDRYKELTQQFKSANAIQISAGYDKWAEAMKTKARILCEIKEKRGRVYSPVLEGAGIFTSEYDRKVLFGLNKLKEPDLQETLKRIHRKLSRNQQPT
jgi:hypothetical protein